MPGLALCHLGSCLKGSRRVNVSPYGRGVSPPHDSRARVLYCHACACARADRLICCDDGPLASRLALRALKHCTSTHRVLTAPRASLATRRNDFATNHHEYAGRHWTTLGELRCSQYEPDKMIGDVDDRLDSDYAQGRGKAHHAVPVFLRACGEDQVAGRRSWLSSWTQC